MKVKRLISFLMIFVIFILSFQINSKALTTTIDMSSIRWSNNTLVYDGNEKRVYLENFPSDFPNDIHFIYENERATEVGLYVASVRLSYDDDKYHLINLKFQPDKDWQIRKPSVVDDTGTITISADYGIHPNQTVIYQELDLNKYSNADVSVAGAYQEVKKAFTIEMMENDRPTMPDGVVVVEFTIPQELLYVEDLEIFDYGMNRLKTLESRVKDGKIIFNTHHLSDVYLVVGMRATYTNNQIWKVYLILTVIIVGSFGVVVAYRVKKRKQETIKYDQELYTRSKL